MRRLGVGLVFAICGMVACGDDPAPTEGSPATPDGADGGSSSSSSSGGASSGSTSSGGSSSGGSSSGSSSGDGGATNDPPSATNGALTVEMGDAIGGKLAGSDANGDALSFAIVTQPTKGTITNLDAATGAFTYTSTGFAPGSDSFTFKVNDGKADSATPGTMNVTLDSVLFTGHYAMANVKDNASTSCSSSGFRVGHARATSASGYIVVSQRQIVCGSTTYTFQPVRLDLGGSTAITDTVMTFSQSKFVSGCGTVTDDFRLEKNANGTFSFKETASAPCVGTHVLTADATRTPVAYLLAEPNASVAFGHAFSGDVVAPKPVTLRNIGRKPASPLALTSVTTPFSLVAGGTCGAQLAGLSTCTFSIGMGTSALGDFSSAWAAEYMDGVDAEVEAWSISGTVVPKLPNPTAITVGSDFTCAITNGNVVCWGGSNTYGQTKVPALTNPKSISAGINHVCAIDDTGVKCWGANESGQTTVPTLVNPKQVSAGYDHTCAIDDTGVVCWGGNGFKQSTVPALTSPTTISAGTWLSCAIHASGVTCWGNSNGTTVPALSSPTEVVAAGNHACAVDSTGVVCWGASAYGATTPPALTAPTHLDGAGYRGCAISAGTVTCWGIDSNLTPSVTQATALAVGDNHVCAIANGAVRCWAGQTYP